MKGRLTIVMLLVVVGCNYSKSNVSNITPAGFWTNYKANYIIKKSSDQGAWGGYREIHWKSKIANTFTSKDVIAFASKNGWTYTDSYSFNYLEKMKSESVKPYDDYSDEIVNTVPFTWSVNPIMRFKTGWRAVQPGNAKDTDRNGFVGINTDGTELFVYHIWGE